MINIWSDSARQRSIGEEPPSQRRAMGAGERRRWSSLGRSDTLDAVIRHLNSPVLHGAAILGPRGVGKTTLSREVEAHIAGALHVVHLFGSGSESEVPFGAFCVPMARLAGHIGQPSAVILQRLVDLVKQDAKRRPTVIILDELPGIDAASIGVLMQLVLSGAAKLLVMARTTSELPEDLAGLVKDGLLATEHLEVFTRAEVHHLLSRVLEGAVAESVVAAFYSTSAGHPLVLQALVHENLDRGVLRQHGDIWVLTGELSATIDNNLVELVEYRLARLPVSVRVGLEKIALLRKVTLVVALRAVGSATLTELEQQGFLTISTGANGVVSLAEPFIGETLRGQQTSVQKAQRFQEMAGVLEMEPERMDKQQLLTFAAWAHDAGWILKPEAALAVAQAAVQYFDPQLALASCAHVSSRHPQNARAAQLRSRAYSLLANYPMAVGALDAIAPEVLSAMGPTDYASWAMNATSSLLWVPNGYSRIEELLADVAWRIQQAAADEDTSQATKYLNLARFEFQVHRGEFAQAAPDLVAGSHDPDDAEYRLNCASLLALVWATTGRELDAVALSKAISAEAKEHNLALQMGDWHFQAMVLALMWTGQWRTCEKIMKEVVAYSSRTTQFRGGTMELVLGLAYTYAGQGMEAAEVLRMAAAQLEIRDTFNSLNLAYGALAFAFTQINDVTNARRYLAKTAEYTRPTLWVNRSMSEFFQLMALRRLDDQTATAQLVAAAEIDMAKGRFTTASMNVFGATIHGTNEQYQLLEETSLSRQGLMAEVNVGLARAHRQGSAALALQAADVAHALDLAAVESRCVAMAIDLARTAGEMHLFREAQHRLDELQPQTAALPVSLHQASVPLTQREQQVAVLAAQGMANQEIAMRIRVSIRTVEGHLYQVFAKMGITSRSELKSAIDL